MKRQNHKKRKGKKKNVGRKRATQHETTDFLRGNMPDRIVQTFIGIQSVTNYFNVASQIQGAALYMTSMGEFSSGVTATYQYFSNAFASYKRYRVLHSKIQMEFRSREATNYQHLVLVPSDAATVPSSATTFEGLAQNPFAKQLILAPNGTTGCIKRFSHSFAPQKIVGREYFEQDEYSSANTGAMSPATPLYWIFGCSASGTNTVSTGGIEVNLKLIQKIELYELERTTTKNLVLRYDPSNLDSLDVAISKLELASSKLRRRST